MKYDIDRIKQQVTIPELLNRRGIECATNKKMICSPLRDEKTPSFSISNAGRRFHDFGSGTGGDVIDLEMELTGCSKADAIKTLAGICGISGEVDHHDLAPIPPPPRYQATRKLGDMIKAEDAKEARHRLKRFLGDPTWACCQTLAWLPPHMQKTVLKKGFLGADIRGRLMYLMRRGVKVRTLPESSRGDRWIYGKSQDNALFSWLHQDLGSGGPRTVMFTEGESDAMTAIARWDECVRVVGCMSSNIAPPMEILYAMARDCDRAIIAFDGDEAGRTGSKGLVALLQRIFPHLEIVNYRTPNKMDLKAMFLNGSIGILDDLVSK